MYDRPTISPQFRRSPTTSRTADSDDQGCPAESRDENVADCRPSRQRGYTPGTVAQLRWFGWVLAALVGLCLLLAAWVWMEILRAGL